MTQIRIYVPENPRSEPCAHGHPAPTREEFDEFWENPAGAPPEWWCLAGCDEFGSEVIDITPDGVRVERSGPLFERGADS